MTAVYSYDYVYRLTLVLHNTAQFASTLFLALIFRVIRQLMYKHATPCTSIGLFSPPSNLTRSSINLPTAFPMHLFTPLRGLCLHTRAALSRLVHHRLLTVHLFLIFLHNVLADNSPNLSFPLSLLLVTPSIV